jgi:hypothetical protein
LIIIHSPKVHGYMKEFHMSDCPSVLDKTYLKLYKTPIILLS